MQDPASLIENYHPTDRTMRLLRSMRVILLVGISGAGKDTVKGRLLQLGRYQKIVSHITREPRENRGLLEQDGVHYYFVKMDRMTEMIKNQELFEVNLYANNLYGTSAAELQRAADADKIAVADVDVNGVEAYMKIAPHAVRPIFLVPPSYDVWFERWKGRYGDDYVNHLDDFARRKQAAIKELHRVLKTPYFYFVVNDKLESTIQEVDEIAHSGRQTKASYEAGRITVEAVLEKMES